jgi:hypothetical protein
VDQFQFPQTRYRSASRRRTSASPSVSAPASSANISEYMAAIGRKGGQIGGKRRLKTMTKAQRSKIAAKAAKADGNRRSDRARNHSCATFISSSFLSSFKWYITERRIPPAFVINQESSEGLPFLSVCTTVAQYAGPFNFSTSKSNSQDFREQRAAATKFLCVPSRHFPSEYARSRSPVERYV